MEDKSTNTELLIVLSPDEVIELKDGLTIATFTKNLQIFVNTLQSDIVFGKPKLSRPDSPNTQIGILNIPPSFHKGSQTRKPVDKEETIIRTPKKPSQESQNPFAIVIAQWTSWDDSSPKRLTLPILRHLQQKEVIQTLLTIHTIVM